MLEGSHGHVFTCFMGRSSLSSARQQIDASPPSRITRLVQRGRPIWFITVGNPARIQPQSTQEEISSDRNMHSEAIMIQCSCAFKRALHLTAVLVCLELRQVGRGRGAGSATRRIWETSRP